jgi:hypothetical protein
LCSRSGAIIFVHVDQQPKLTTIEYISTSEWSRFLDTNCTNL